MIIYTNQENSILVQDLKYNGYINEIRESNECNENFVFIYVVVSSDIDFDFLNKVKCKKLIIDYASNDCITVGQLETIKENMKREHKVISKSLDFKELNHLFYDQQLFRFKSSHNALRPYHDLKRNFHNTYLLPHKKATFFVGHPRYHKLKLLNHLYLNKKLDDLYWTSSDVRYDLPENVHWGFDNMDREEEYFNFDVIKELPQKLDYGYESTEVPLTSIGITFNFGFYLNSCFDIIGETNFHNDYFVHHVSEKILKPIMLGMPFVCLNLPNTISKLEKNFGFDFSDSTFGHEYDTIQNYDERLDVIKTKVTKLLHYSRRDLKKLSYNYYEKQKRNTEILFEVFWKGSLDKIMEYINE
tara:strand:- start:225 stop:1298 length:1074 start_codon:yes stop_codon:yes gene_type:complete